MLTTLGRTAAGIDPQAIADAVTAHSAGISKIVGMIRAKYEDEGQRNFDIGLEALDLAIRQRESVGAKTYSSSDFDCQMNRIRDEVRMFVPIKAESIQVAHWVRCAAMRAEVGKAITPESAALLSMFEYKAMLGQGFRWNSADLEGTINPCWLDMIRTVVNDRTAGVEVKRTDFENRVVATVKRAEAVKLEKLDPVKAAAKVASDKVKADAAAVAKTVKDITTAVDTGIASGAIKPEGALAILEGVAKHHGIPLVASSIGFDPATATIEDNKKIVAGYFAAGKLVELKDLVQEALKAIAVLEKGLEKAKPEPVKAAA